MLSKRIIPCLDIKTKGSKGVKFLGCVTLVIQ